MGVEHAEIQLETSPDRREGQRSRWASLPMRLLGLAVIVCMVLLGIAWRWREIVVVRKSIGLLTDMSWSDVADVGRPGSLFALKSLARSGNPYSAIHDPYTTPSDRARGRELFDVVCSKCHGAGARGGLGPALIGRPLSHGDSDWALYRTITRGVPGTPMSGNFIARRDVWRVIAYLRALVPQTGGRRTSDSEGARANVGALPDTSYATLLESSTSGAGEWMLPVGSYSGQRFSRDGEINVRNVSRLAVRWIHQFPPAERNESSPIVAGDYLYVSQPPGNVYALDARTGQQIWHYTRNTPPDIRVCCIATTRGVSVLGGRVYFATLDAHLIALDAATGAVAWDRAVADYQEGYSLTAPPLPVGDLVITGIAGGEFPIRGFISAYEAATGKLRWRFMTVPEPGQPGSETWGAGSWKTGGAPTWGIGAYDPELGLVYWGVGSAAPDFDAARRPGDDLYSNSVVALNASTGKLAWYFQFLPGDDHDWDSIQTPSLIDLTENGVPQKLLVVANRGGFFYVLDRRSGAFIRAAPFVKQTWARGLSASGRPIRAPNSSPSKEGTYIVPSVNGATNWWPSTYSPLTGLYYVDAEQGGSLFFLNSSDRARRGRMFVGGATTYGDWFSDLVEAIDPRTATVKWVRHNSVVTSAPRGGLLSTAGGVLFGSDGPTLYALDAKSGEQLWSFDTGGHISAPPITYRVGGRQVVAVVAGQDLITFGLPPS